MDPGPTRRLAPGEFRDRLALGEPLVLLDVRQPAERALAAIPAPASCCDLFIPLDELPARLEEVRREAGPVVVYCHHGVRSLMAARWLAAQGIAGVADLDGGIDAWSIRVDAGVPRYG